jgi:type III secretion system FlhB-like substrate exporter
MKTIIAGSRAGPKYSDLIEAIKSCGWSPSVIVSGTAKGADQLGESWAENNGVPIERYPADWNKFGRAAGPIRNKQMAQNAEALIALWDGKSSGTKNMIELAKTYGLKVYVRIFEDFV